MLKNWFIYKNDKKYAFKKKYSKLIEKVFPQLLDIKMYLKLNSTLSDLFQQAGPPIDSQLGFKLLWNFVGLLPKKKDQEKQFAKIWNIIRKSWRLHTPWEHLDHRLLGSPGTMEIWIGQHRCLSWIIWTREMKMWKSPKTSPIRGLILSSEDEIRLLDHLHPDPRGPRVSMRL